MYRGVNHLALVTNDMDMTVRFYRDTLGMPVVGTTRAGQFRHYFFGIGPRSAIAFFEWPDVELPPRKDSGVPESGRQFDHVSVDMESIDALLGLQDRLRRAGVPASDVVDHAPVKSIYIEDPNGISLEFSVGTTEGMEQPFLTDPDPIPALRE